MVRLLCTTALMCAVPVMGLAQDMVLRADIAEAEVNARGAEITRRASATLPAGESRVFIAMPDVDWAGLVQVTGPEGVRFGPAEQAEAILPEEGALDTPAQAAAREAVSEAEEALLRTQDEIAGAEAEIRAIEAQLDYLTALTRGEGGVPMPDNPRLVPEFATTLGAEMRRVVEELSATRALRRDLSERVTERQEVLEAAEAALERLRPFGERVAGIEVTVTAEAETDAILEIDYLSRGVAWAPSYALHLDSESGTLDIERSIILSVDSPARWQGVDVTFSTANPSRQRVPQEVFSRPARIMEEMERLGSPEISLDGVRAVAAPMPAMVAEPAGFAGMVVEGLAISYEYGTPVSVGGSGEATLPFDALRLDMETEARAAPRFDQTAFLMAMGDNDTGEPILPGEALFYRDGALVGESYLDLIPAGAEMDLAFGSLDHLQLVWIDRSNAEGDRGLFVSSNTQDRALAFGVENTGDSAETVRLIYAVPFAEQEDLDLEVSLSRAPDEVDVDDRRGVQAWQIDVAPGATEMIEMDVSFSWPEGQILDWRP